MDLSYSAEDEAFRAEIRGWLEEHLTGDFAALKGLGGPGQDHEAIEERLAWNRHLAEHGWTGVGWPTEHGGRGLSLWQQVIFHEEYARSDAPARVNHLGEELLGPTLIAFGTDEQKQRFLPRILAVEELWAQGYSEPDAGSDLANVKTKARARRRRVGHRRPEGVDVERALQPVDLRHRPHRARLARATRGCRSCSCRWTRTGVDVRPIEQLTGGSEFNEVFFTGARTDADLVVGEPGEGWGVAMGLLGFERGVSILAQLVDFARELDGAGRRWRASNGAIDDPVLRDRLAVAQGRARGHAVQRAAQPVRRHRRRGLVGRRGSGVDLQAGLGALAQAARRARDGRARARRA